jgi:uncharacterized phage protein gp47/JayE
MSVEFEKELGTKSFDDIVAYTLQSIIQKDVGISNINPGSVLRTLVEVFSENEDTANYYLEYVYKCMDIDNCHGEDLDRSVKILGLIRETSKAAVGEITLYTGDNPAEYDIEIPYGYIVSTRPNRNGDVTEFYISDADVVLKAGESKISVAITCTEPGLIYIPTGTIDVMSQSLQGINSVINEKPINGGRDVESDEDFRKRIKNIRETFGKCTNEAIETAVNQIEGVTKASVVDMYSGVGTTGIIIVTDVIPPPDSVKADIDRTVRLTKASGIHADIIYSNIKTIGIEITIAGDGIQLSESDYTSIATAINNYCASLNSGQSFIIKQMERKVLNAIDMTEAENDNADIVTVLPMDNVSSTADQIIRPSYIKVNGITINNEESVNI